MARVKGLPAFLVITAGVFVALARPLDDVPNATWWVAGQRSHLVLQRDGFWIEMETSLPPRELRRFADTLTAF